MAKPAARLQRQDGERANGRDQRCRQERQPKQQVERHRSTDELGQIRRHRDELCDQPQRNRDGLRVTLTTRLRERHARGDTKLRAHRLHEHAHQVGDQNDPQQHVPVARAGRNVGGEVARVDVGNCRYESGSKKRPQLADATTVARQRFLGRRQHARLTRQGDSSGVFERFSKLRGRHI